MNSKNSAPNCHFSTPEYQSRPGFRGNFRLKPCFYIGEFLSCSQSQAFFLDWTAAFKKEDIDSPMATMISIGTIAWKNRSAIKSMQKQMLCSINTNEPPIHPHLLNLKMTRSFSARVGTNGLVREFSE